MVDNLPIYDDIPTSQDPSPLGSSQKRLLGFLIVVVIVGVGLTFWQYFQNINDPFNRSRLLLASGQTENIDDLSALENTDTDGDGLSDLEEISIHQTSVYLADSDSDGLSDFAEVAKGSDPLCPEGQDCYSPSVLDQEAVSSFAQLSGDLQASLDDQTAANGLQGADLAAVLSQLPADQLRELLLQNGFPQDVIDQLSDEQLYELVTQTVSQEATTDTATPTTQPEQPTAAETTQSVEINENNRQILLEQINQMTPTEVKNFLLQFGFDEATVNQTEPEELKATLLQLLGG